MGKHNADPDKTDIPHKAVRVVRTRSHVWIIACKHFIVEGSAGFLAIIVFEANRAGWLNLVGANHDVPSHAIRTFVMFL